ncbi:HAMP domain-containing histidine kinase [Naumannella sp. ID2617S]|nr:HAMP domain-containing histidine kinase [Naumannella sp. ID2617S]
MSPILAGVLGLLIGLLLGGAGAIFWLRPRLLAAQAELARGEGQRAELTADLADRDQQLANADRRHDELVGQAAEQLRAPLAVLGSELQALAPDGDDPHRSAAEREVRRINRLAGDLTTLAKVQRGDLELESTEVELKALLTELTDRLRPQFEAAGGTLSLLPGGTARVYADRRQLSQVVINLLGNALQACADKPTPEVIVGVSRTSIDGAPVGRITITDNGCGLSAEESERVFERFHRAPGSRPGPGAGLGLTIARSVVRAQDGELRLSSPGVGRGATATLTLPRAE